jgi:hypothetical protein
MVQNDEVILANPIPEIQSTPADLPTLSKDQQFTVGQSPSKH